MTQLHDWYANAHRIGRLSGEGPEHPRQKIVHWLEEHGRGSRVADFNRHYAAACSEGRAGSGTLGACYAALMGAIPDDAVLQTWREVFFA